MDSRPVRALPERRPRILRVRLAAADEVTPCGRTPLHQSGGNSPCHLDFMPRNMIHGDDGILRLIEFEHSRYDLPARDLVRLATRIWPHRPDLRDSFLHEYGHPSALDREVLEHCAHLDALTTLCTTARR
ncbi:phosphotransferase family protein [Micromonospora chalcea]